MSFFPEASSKPKMSQFKGIESFTGTCFHTARWNYESTGGSPEDSSLVKLKDKRVGIIGTGATAIQVVPQLAKWSKELHPPSIFGKGWQNIRTRNFNSFISNIKPSPAINMVNDEWTRFPFFSGLLGGPQTVTLDNVTQFVADLHALDLPRQERLRNRIDEVVTEQSVAELLKPWYAGWCKRPCFHDEYLPAFNNPHVTLVDTAGKGVDCINETGVMISGKQYDLDIIVFSTDFFVDAKASIPKRLGIDVFGRKGIFLEDKWQQGVATLHGSITRDFPNLFFASEQQGPAAVNYVSCLDIAARHAAYIITEAQKRFGQHMKVTIEPTRDAEAAWSERIAAGATGLTALAGCTPGYYNLGGSADKLSAQAKVVMLRSASWPNGINDFCDVIESWHQAGDLNGLDIHGLEQ
ncbi:unnamed protein product [Penicillium salamii]|uniref:Monooxygenase n=1 Tax=Penicillium salamii TaxID=1612424 RepID=A0A9W4JWY6_9EURO|nr:unnamed protein product [Penicillium salamii]